MHWKSHCLVFHTLSPLSEPSQNSAFIQPELLLPLSAALGSFSGETTTQAHTGYNWNSPGASWENGLVEASAWQQPAIWGEFDAGRGGVLIQPLVQSHYEPFLRCFMCYNVRKSIGRFSIGGVEKDTVQRMMRHYWLCVCGNMWSTGCVCVWLHIWILHHKYCISTIATHHYSVEV